jgi:hypothetical protein
MNLVFSQIDHKILSLFLSNLISLFVVFASDFPLAGQIVREWEVYNFQLDDLSTLPTTVQPSKALALKTLVDSTRNVLSRTRRALSSPLRAHSSKDATLHAMSSKPSGPTFYRGTLRVDGKAAEAVTDAGGASHLACSYLSTRGWGKGIAWVNGFNLGWYWPSKGPQMTLYVPGPVLRPGDNDVVFLEVESAPADPVARFTESADFFGPAHQAQEQAMEQSRRGNNAMVD